jgi:hypothetical protein
MTRIACAHSVVPLLQTSQMSGRARSGHGSVRTGGGPASTQPVTQSKKPFELQLHVVEQPSGDVPAVPQPSPCEHAEPWKHPVGAGGLLHMKVHWLCPVLSQVHDAAQLLGVGSEVTQALLGLHTLPCSQRFWTGGHGNSSTHW